MARCYRRTEQLRTKIRELEDTREWIRSTINSTPLLPREVRRGKCGPRHTRGLCGLSHLLHTTDVYIWCGCVSCAPERHPNCRCTLYSDAYKSYTDRGGLMSLHGALSNRRLAGIVGLAMRMGPWDGRAFGIDE